jgi:hypothetical protein
MPCPVRSRTALPFLVALLAFQAAHAAEGIPVAQQATEVRLTGDVVTLPITRVKAYPFIESSVAGNSGKLRLDTGESAALVVNDHRVPLADAKPLGAGNYGSGQHFETHINTQVRDVRIGNLSFPSVSQVASHDATQLEQHITPDFIGWFGYAAFQDYAMRIDYGTMKATFYKGDVQKVVAGEKVVATLHTPGGKRPNIMLAAGKVGSEPVDVAFDTGQQGALFLDATTRDRLVKEGALTREQDGTFTVKHLVVDGWTMPPLAHLDLTEGKPPFGPAIGATGKSFISIGYALLGDHPTLWDFRGKTIYVLGSTDTKSR